MGYIPVNCEYLGWRGNAPAVCECPSHQRSVLGEVFLGKPGCVYNYFNHRGASESRGQCPDEKPRPRPAPPRGR